MEKYICPNCGKISFNANDIKNRYCGYCHTFSDDLDWSPAVKKAMLRYWEKWHEQEIKKLNKEANDIGG